MESSSPLQATTAPELSIGDLLADYAAADPERVLLERHEGASWVPVTAAQMHSQVTALAKGLIGAGIQPGDRVGIMSRTRPEWTLLDFAIWYAGAVTVPVYETSSPSQTAWILRDGGVRAVVVETAENESVVAEARAKAPELEQVWQIDAGGLDALRSAGADVADEDVRARRDAVRIEDLATIIYTSGTTGRPKGAELTHGNFVELSRNAIAALGDQVLGDGSRTLLFMPLAHVFARFISVLTVAAGVAIGHTPDTRTLMDDVASFHPTFILSVPRVFEKVYNGAEAKSGGGAKLKIFRWAAKVSAAYSRALDAPGGAGPVIRAQRALADRLVLGKIREALGGQAVYAISGGAPLGDRLGHFFRGVGLIVLEGYGLTETTAPVAVNVPEKVKIGTVGPPLPGISLRTADDGEVLVKGIPVFRGYHNNPEGTAEALEDGWFRTGDLGEIDSDGYLKITGRKKEIIVTAGGKNVVPSYLEDRLRGHPLVSQCVVVGDHRPFVAAIITLDEEMLPSWLSNHGLPQMSVAEAAANPAVLESLEAGVQRASRKVSRAEGIRYFEVLAHDFTIENGYLTPSLKVRRQLVLKDFAQFIDDMYAHAAQSRADGHTSQHG